MPFFENPPGMAWCGPAALRMVLAHYGIQAELFDLAVACNARATGTLASELVRAARSFGARADMKIGLDMAGLSGEVGQRGPVIVLLHPSLLHNVLGPPGHFVVVTRVGADGVMFHDRDVGQGLLARKDAFEAAFAAKGGKMVAIWTGLP